MGMPGFSYKLPEFPGWCFNRLRELGEFYIAHSTDYVLNGDAYRLTPQPLTNGRGERFPVFEFVSPGKDALVYAFRMTGAPEKQKILLKGLEAGAIYRAEYLDGEILLEKTGAELMRDGLCFEGLPEEASEVVEILKI